MAMSRTTCPAERGTAMMERIVAEDGNRRAPRRKIREGVGPANSDGSCIGGLPSVGAAAHPVVGVGERDAADAVVGAEFDGA